MPTPTKPASASPASPNISPLTVRILLGLICFCAGASVMVIEISANRLLAPYFGNSIYTWTALIGVVLVAFSVGGYTGGRLADKFGKVSLLGWLLLGSAIFTLLIPPIVFTFAPKLSLGGLIAGPVFISLLLFTIPGILLGAVSPACVRFYSQAVGQEHVGAAAGVISMLGSLGSFVGTFLSGFVLLALFGVKTIFLGTSILLVLLAFAAFWMARSWKNTGGALGGLVVAAVICLTTNEASAENVIYQEESFYHRIRVKTEQIDGREARTLQLDNTQEGGIFVTGSGLPLVYQNYWKLAQINDGLKIKRALFMGAGAFGMPAQVSLQDGVEHVDVAEIDPAVVKVGRMFFRLDEHPKVDAHALDARRFLNTSEGNYDLIFGDAYHGIRHIPAHLVTQEFFSEIKGKLSDKGVFFMNVITSVEGPRSELLADLLVTIRSVFPHVRAVAVGGNLRTPQNVILIASKEDWKPWLEDKFYTPGSELATMLRNLLPDRNLPGNGQLYTDDKNPVDAVIARQLLSNE